MEDLHTISYSESDNMGITPFQLHLMAEGGSKNGSRLRVQGSGFRVNDSRSIMVHVNERTI